MLEPQRIRRVWALAPRFLAWLGIVLLAGGAHAQVSVTSLDGELISSGRSLSLHSQLAPGQVVELSKAGRGAFLVGNDELVRLCDGAKASFAGVKTGEPTRVELSRGDLSATVGAEAAASPLQIETPSASITVLGSSVYVTVSPGGDTTTVSSLEGRIRVSRRSGSDAGPLLIDTDERVAVVRGRAPGKAERFSRAELAKSSACLRSDTHRASAVAASSLTLLLAAPPVSAGVEDASEIPSDLEQIVAADFPRDGVPLDEPSTPSALINELSKAGLDEEVCDPITCNPVYQLPGPEMCGPVPVVGCIP